MRNLINDVYLYVVLIVFQVCDICSAPCDLQGSLCRRHIRTQCRMSAYVIYQPLCNLDKICVYIHIFDINVP
jgi:hypothetical protein